MEDIFIEKTQYTPEVKSDLEACVLNIAGKSYPENTFEFYKPINAWIKTFIATHKDKELTFNFEIIYFNSSSSKALFDLFDSLEESVKNGLQIIVNWIYDEDNESMEEAGEDFIDDFEVLQINLVKK